MKQQERRLSPVAMPVLDALRSMLGKEDRTFTYQCRECDRVFEASTPSESQASCPNCEKSRTVSVPGTSPDE